MDVELRQALRAGNVYEKLRAIHACAEAGAAALVPDLAALLSSEEYAPGSHPGHSPLCQQAAYAIRQIGVAPDIEILRALLANERVNEFPVACYDQGMYIGDYASEEIAPAGLAAALVPLMGASGLGLTPELERNARHPNDKIAEPATLAIEALRKISSS